MLSYVEMVETKIKAILRNALCVVSHVKTVYTLRSKHVMHQWFNVDTVDTVVFAAFTQMHTDTQTWCTAYMPLTPPREKALLSPLSCGFSGSPSSSQRMQLCFKMFWDLSNYKGNCRQDAQPIPNS